MEVQQPHDVAASSAKTIGKWLRCRGTKCYLALVTVVVAVVFVYGLPVTDL